MAYKLLVCSFCRSKCPDGIHWVDLCSMGTIYEAIEATVCPYCREGPLIKSVACPTLPVLLVGGTLIADLTTCYQCSLHL